MSLTAEQIAARKGRLTASRVGVLMRGDRDGIMQLYKEMIGEAVEEDLSNVWAVQLGVCTEPLSLNWYEKKNGYLLTRRGEVVVHPQHNWAAATLDGFDGTLQCCVECKHVGGREPHEVVVDRYQPQMQWQMFVTNSKQCALSVIRGADEPLVDYIDRDDTYIAEMVTRAESFMMCVAMKMPPFPVEPAPPPTPDPTKIIDMNTDNAWGSAAFEWISTRDAAASNKDAEKILKAKVPADAKKCFGYGVRITRDRAGRLSLREDK